MQISRINTQANPKFGMARDIIDRITIDHYKEMSTIPSCYADNYRNTARSLINLELSTNNTLTPLERSELERDLLILNRARSNNDDD